MMMDTCDCGRGSGCNCYLSQPMTYEDALKIIDGQQERMLEAACFINKAECPHGMSPMAHTINRITAIKIINATIDARKFVRADNYR